MLAVVVRNGRDGGCLPRDHGFHAASGGVYRSLPAHRQEGRVSALRLFVRAALVAQIVAYLTLAVWAGLL